MLKVSFRSYEEAERAFDAGLLEDEYAEYLMVDCAGDLVVCNGDMLLEAMESHMFLDGFLNSLLG